VPTDVKISAQPKWDVFENNHFAMRKRLVGIFLKVANKLITRIRAGKRLKAIKKRFTEEKIFSRADLQRLVEQDYKNSQNSQMTDGAEGDSHIKNVKFKFGFNKAKIANQVQMPIEYETNIASFMEKIDAQPVANFDDFMPFDPLEQLDFEIMRYQPMPVPPMSMYDPIFDDKSYRPGCQYESILRQVSGEPDLEKIQMQAHLQMELLKKKEKDIVSGANVAMPSGFRKPLEYSVDLLVRTHPTLRQYKQQVPCTEVDPEFQLYPAKRDREQLKDEIMLRNATQEKDKSLVMSLSKSVAGTFINEVKVSGHDIPGNFGVRVLETMPTNIRDVFVQQHKNLQLEYVCDYRYQGVPTMMQAPDKNDYLTDDESDDGAEFEIKVPELSELIQ